MKAVNQIGAVFKLPGQTKHIRFKLDPLWVCRVAQKLYCMKWLDGQCPSRHIYLWLCDCKIKANRFWISDHPSLNWLFHTPTRFYWLVFCCHWREKNLVIIYGFFNFLFLCKRRSFYGRIWATEGGFVSLSKRVFSVMFVSDFSRV